VKILNYIKNNLKIRSFLLINLPSSVKKYFGVFPFNLNNESRALSKVLKSGNWNMSYGKSTVHEQLEKEFAEYIGTAEAIAVGGGGLGIQMSLRALGLERDSEVLMQIDTCSAVAMATLNSQTIPRFFDAHRGTFLSDPPSVEAHLSSKTGAIIATHIWGNLDDIESLRRICEERDIYLIEDACLALGTKMSGSKAGSFGKVGIFSFGSTKPIQAGEGGIVVTNDRYLAKELRAMRHWGERTKDFGLRDVSHLSWNGRLSEFSAAVALEQLRGYDELLNKVHLNVHKFQEFLSKEISNVELNLGNSLRLEDSSFTQAVLRLNGFTPKLKENLLSHLSQNGVTAFHANFEPISTLSLFKTGEWTKWMNTPDWNPNSELEKQNFPNAFEIYNRGGIGISRTNFQSKYTFDRLINGFKTFKVMN
jgi:dTDP-4-amino-4,6-dideoxygalactose transaminase